MPKFTKRYNISELVLSRTVGVEMEGYVTAMPRTMQLNDTNPIKSDGSLSYQCWHETNPRNGVEITTVPLRDLSKLEQLFDGMMTYGWHVDYDDQAGTHIHVCNGDFNSSEMARLLWFGKQIEDVMFMFVKKYRRERGWCNKIDEVWNNEFLLEPSFWTDNDYYVRDYDIEYNGQDYYLENEKYTWMNALSTDYDTVEFRIFHAIENKEELVRFAYLVHNMVELVKNSTVDQLKFIVESLKQLNDSREVGDAFCRALGLNFRLPLRSRSAERQLEKAWNLPVYQQRQAEREAQRQAQQAEAV